VPVIGSFSASPAVVQAGNPFTLTAGNVTEAGGTISTVAFYLESNGVSGLQIGSDLFVGNGTQSGSNWSPPPLDTTGWGAGTYTFYAVATDAAGVSSDVASTNVTVTTTVSSGVLLGWDVAGLTNFGPQGFAATQVTAGVSNSLGLNRGSGVTTTGSASSNAWGGNGWAASSAAGLSGNKYVTFGLTVSPGSAASLASVDLSYRRSGTGPTNGYWQYQVNGGAFVTLGDFTNEFPSTSGTITELNLAGAGALQSLPAGTAVVLRLVPYGTTNPGGTWYVADQAGNDLVVNGSVQGGMDGGNAPPGASGAGADLAIALFTAGRRWSLAATDPGVPALWF
jgi:hypothetical protein